MSKYLVFQLYGPMAAWGEIAVGETRRSAVHPSKSTILGLLAAACGIDRNDEETHIAMAHAYNIAVKVLAPGSLLVDYHTVQVPPRQRNAEFKTRKEELTADKLGTLLSNRQYRCDAAYVVAVWIKKQPAPFSVEKLADALQQPKYTLYLGRRSCPLALPLCPIVIEDLPLKAALDSFMCSARMKGRVTWKQSPMYYSDEGQLEGFVTESLLERWDVPRSRCRWQFSPRTEFLLMPEEEA